MRKLRYFTLTASLAMLGVVPGVWILVASRADVHKVGRNVDIFAGPLRYFVCILIVAALWILVAWVIQRRDRAYYVASIAIVSAGGLLTLLVSLGAAFDFVSISRIPFAPAGSAVRWQPQPVPDEGAFLRARAHAYADPISSGHPGEYVYRRSWRVDEYGERPHDPAALAIGLRWALPWEEYGLPLRCFRSPLHFDWPRPGPRELREWFPSIMARLALMPVPFMINVAAWSGLILVLLRAPGIVVRRHRKQEGRCVQCGYILKGLQRCPECGEKKT